MRSGNEKSPESSFLILPWGSSMLSWLRFYQLSASYNIKIPGRLISLPRSALFIPIILTVICCMIVFVTYINIFKVKQNCWNYKIYFLKSSGFILIISAPTFLAYFLQLAVPPGVPSQNASKISHLSTINSFLICIFCALYPGSHT